MIHANMPKAYTRHMSELDHSRNPKIYMIKSPNLNANLPV